MKKLFTKFINLFFIVSCQKYCELDSAQRDRSLSSWEKIAHRIHHFHCTFCRRFHRQVEAMEEVAKTEDFINYSSDNKLSEKQKQQIAASLANQSKQE